MIIFDNFISVSAYILRQRRIPRLFSPKTLTEKILKIKVSPKSSRELREVAADRVLVRDYVQEKSDSCQLIPLLWVGTNFNEDVWNNLPIKFVIKANHGSKMVKIIDKSKHNFVDVCEEVKVWLKTDYYKKGREWVYKNIERTLVVEEYIEFSGDVPPDYKFFCLNGNVEMVQVDLERYKGHKRNIYDSNFNILDVEYHLPTGENITKPTLFDTAKRIAEELSKDFDFIRVDLYILESEVFFGELTNFPGNCLEGFKPQSYDLSLGQKLILKE